MENIYIIMRNIKYTDNSSNVTIIALIKNAVQQVFYSNYHVDSIKEYTEKIPELFSFCIPPVIDY